MSDPARGAAGRISSSPSRSAGSGSALDFVFASSRLDDPAFATVAGLTLGCAFGHMGEYAALYKRTYGVSPRETLQKKPRA
ncbi:hypothetical protein [Microvirga subterranea]|uniref:HTH araC/xylS-type domain-containing protein n=1 Tax=Microvirga subterranea TaxID=186651 RepID=A0A370HGQ9_9HYPH|nr:hypothetical protein [Microvirga subterranea]RDI57094.1 hypothetical protein DES45_1078 [Microvirga subterranea]